MIGSIERLRAEIRADRASFSTQIDELRALPGSLTDRGEIARSAWALHHAYTSAESVLERIARGIEGGLPSKRLRR